MIQRETGLRSYKEAGIQLKAEVSTPLLMSIFNPESPMHDGAVILQNTLIEASGCILPLTESQMVLPEMGTRHRAALGITEESDAIVVIISEERGTISTAENGRFTNLEMEMNDDTWQLVKHTPRVSTFVGGKKDKPAPISKSDVDNIINRIEVGEEAPRPKTLFEPGEVIRVCDGPFNDFNGVVEEVDYERSSVKVSVQILGRSTPVQLDFIQIEKT